MPRNIRNFTIISHIDHGKSTLADRFLELTKTIPEPKMKEQFLDQMALEREKGITIRMHPVQIEYVWQERPYLLNLIDTPGHIDFSYEVSRALAAVEGAVLLVDATQGIQAQTINHLRLAQKQNLKIIPVINKIDLSQADVPQAKSELADLLGVNPKVILEISAKKGWGIENLLQRIIQEIPAPDQDEQKYFRGLIFDSYYDTFQGSIIYLRVKDGFVQAGEDVRFLKSQSEGEVKEVGFFKPNLKKEEALRAGDIGYLITGLKNANNVKIGDTVVLQKEASLVSPLPGYQEPQPVVFNDLYPREDQNFEDLKISLERLKLNDPALVFKPVVREGLGKGFQIGCLGLLHTEVVVRRLEQEFSLDLLITAPTVSYRLQTNKGEEVVNSPVDWPTEVSIKKIEEPWVEVEIIVPIQYLGKMMKILGGLSGQFEKQLPLTGKRFLLIYQMPLREMISGFDNQLKSATEGRASWRYRMLGYRPADLVKLEVFIVNEKRESFAKIVSRREAYQQGQRIAEKLYRLLPPQQFAVPIQVYQGGKVIVRRTLKARRKDVTAPLYGGDWTRKKKLLVRQRQGKKDLAKQAKMRIPSQVFLEMLKETD